MGFTDLNKPKKTNGADNVNISNPNSTFGEVLVVNAIPIAQGDFVYNINTQNFTTSAFAGSSVTQVSGACELSSGTESSGSATVQLRRRLEYRPGQGSLMRATALFDTPSAGNAMFVGAGTGESGYFIGYFATNFGVLHSITGQREIRRLDITTAAGSENVTVTLDSDSVVIPVVGGGSEEQTAYQLSLGDYSQVGKGGWLADAVSGSVYFISARSNATSTGSYSAVGASAGSLGSFTRVAVGEAQTNNFISSGSFNIDKLDGTGPSGMTLDPQKGNVYQIGIQYLGYGNAHFAIEDPETGKFAPFHIIKNANNVTTPVLKNPNLGVLATSANIGGTISKTLKTVSMAGFSEGNIQKLDPKFAKSFTFSGVNSATYVPIAILKANRVFDDQSCFGEFDILRLAASNESTAKTLTVGLFLNVEVTGEVNYQNVNGGESIVSYSDLTPTGLGANTIVDLANLNPFYELLIGALSADKEDLDPQKFILQPGQNVLIAIKTSGSIAGQISISWFEQQ